MNHKLNVLERPQLIYNYFKQLFAQVTNPPLDGIREELITDISLTLGSDYNIFNIDDSHCKKLKIQNPVISKQDLDKIKSLSYTFIISFLIQILIPLISIIFLKEYNYITYIIIISLSVGIIFRNVFLFPKISQITVMSEFEKISFILYIVFYFYSIINNNIQVIGIINSLLLIYTMIHFTLNYEKKYKNFIVGSK